MKKFLSYLILCSILVLTLFVGTAFAAVAIQDNDPHKTGLKKPTASDLEWMKKNMKETKKVKLNEIGKERIIQELKRKNASKDMLDKAQSISAVPVGQEVQSTLTAGESGSDFLGAVPASVDNSQLKYFPPIRSQGSIGSCAAFSSVYYQFTHMNALARDWDVKTSDDTKRFSPKWTYNMINGGSDSGSWFSDSFDILRINGGATWSDFPYDSNYRAWSTNANVWRNAINYRINTTGSVTSLNTPTGMANLKQLLTDGYVLVFATYISSWQYTTIKDDPATTLDDKYVGKQVCTVVNGSSGGHGMTIVGYDDNIWVDVNNNNNIDANEKGALRIANSWGTYWGDAGYTWLSYNAVINGACWYNTAYWITAKSSYSPAIVGEFTVNTAMRSSIVPYLGISDAALTTPSKNWYPAALYYDGGPYAFDGTTTACDGNFVLDFTDVINLSGLDMNKTLKYYLNVNDISTGSPTTLKSFTLKNATTGEAIPSLDVFPISVDSGLIRSTINYQSTSVVPVTGITLTQTSATLKPEDSLQLTYTINPSNATDKAVKFMSSNTVVATVDSNGLVKAISAGTAAITVTTNDGGKTATCNITVSSTIPVTGVVILQNSITLKPGETFQLTYSITPENATDKTVTWLSTDTSVVTIDSNGLLHAIADGPITKIIVTTNDGGKTDTCGVIVSSIVPVTSITLSQSAATLKAGDSLQLTSTISPSDATDKTISFMSSNTAVATVDSNGLVKAIADGTAVITVTTNDGGKTATCNVTVNSTIPVTSITLSRTSATLKAGGILQLTYSINPSNATNKTVTWSSSNTAVATVDSNGLVRAISGGSAKITVKTNDGFKTAICTITVRGSGKK